MENIKNTLLAIPQNSIIRITDMEGESEDTLFFGLNAVDDKACLVEGIDMENGVNSVQFIEFTEDETLYKSIEIIKTLNEQELEAEIKRLQELYCSMIGEKYEDTGSEQEARFRFIDSC